jgi:hypothetical protein
MPPAKSKSQAVRFGWFKGKIIILSKADSAHQSHSEHRLNTVGNLLSIGAGIEN